MKMKQKIDPLLYYFYFEDKDNQVGFLFSKIYREMIKAGLERSLVEEILQKSLHAFRPPATDYILNWVMYDRKDEE